MKRLGVITPSSNSVLEPIMSRMLEGAGCTAHFTRIGVRNLSLEKEDLRQFKFDVMLEAARLLADAEVDAIVWCGTAGSWLGPKNDEQMCDAISKETKTKATTTTIAQFAAFKHYGSKKIGLVVPYNESLTKQICDTYAKEGFPIEKKNALGLVSNLEFGRVPPEKIESMIYDIADGVDSISILCTNFSLAPRVERIERKIERIIFDSISVTLWASLQLVGIKESLRGWGQLLEDNPRFP